MNPELCPLFSNRKSAPAADGAPLRSHTLTFRCRLCSSSMPTTTGALNSEERVAGYVDPSPILDSVDDSEEIFEQPPPGPPLGERHVVDDHKKPKPLTADQKAEAARSLRSSTLFQYCSDESIRKVVEHMRREQFLEGEVRVAVFFFFFRGLLVLLVAPVRKK